MAVCKTGIILFCGQRNTYTDRYRWVSISTGKAAEILELAGWNLESGSDYRTKDGVTLEVDMLYDTVFKNGKYRAGASGTV